MIYNIDCKGAVLLGEDLTQKLIDYFRLNDDFHTSKQLSAEFDVSEKTIKRYVTKINEIYEHPIIISERGKGYKFDYQEYLLRIKGKASSESEYRQKQILKKLLLMAPQKLKVSTIFDGYYISDSVIRNDEKILNKQLKKWNLVYKRHDRFAGIEGNEKDIRNALMETILNVDKGLDLSSLYKNASEINDKDFHFTMEQLDLVSSALNSSIPFPYNINFFAHIYILLDRARKYISVQEKEVNSDEKVKSNPEIYSVCRNIVNNIEQYLNRKVDSSEIFYLYEYLVSSRLDNYKISTRYESLAERVTARYIFLVSNILDTNFDNSLVLDMEGHILAMLTRLERNITLPNALLEEIQFEYKEIFDAVKEASVNIEGEYGLAPISDDEIGFITIYFAKYVEIFEEQLNILIMCTTGIGTSELLAVKVSKELPELNIVGVTSNTNIKKYLISNEKKIDFIITTVPLREKLDIPIVLVSALFTKQDKKNVQLVIKEVKNNA